MSAGPLNPQGLCIVCSWCQCHLCAHNNTVGSYTLLLGDDVPKPQWYCHCCKSICMHPRLLVPAPQPDRAGWSPHIGSAPACMVPQAAAPDWGNGSSNSRLADGEGPAIADSNDTSRPDSSSWLLTPQAVSINNHPSHTPAASPGPGQRIRPSTWSGTDAGSNGYITDQDRPSVDKQEAGGAKRAAVRPRAPERGQPVIRQSQKGRYADEVAGKWKQKFHRTYGVCNPCRKTNRGCLPGHLETHVLNGVPAEIWETCPKLEWIPESKRTLSSGRSQPGEDDDP